MASLVCVGTRGAWFSAGSIFSTCTESLISILKSKKRSISKGRPITARGNYPPLPRYAIPPPHPHNVSLCLQPKHVTLGAGIRPQIPLPQLVPTNRLRRECNVFFPDPSELLTPAIPAPAVFHRNRPRPGPFIPHPPVKKRNQPAAGDSSLLNQAAKSPLRSPIAAQDKKFSLAIRRHSNPPPVLLLPLWPQIRARLNRYRRAAH